METDLPPQREGGGHAHQQGALGPSLCFQNGLLWPSVHLWVHLGQVLIAALVQVGGGKTREPPAVRPWGTGQTHYRTVTNVQGAQGSQPPCVAKGAEPRATGREPCQQGDDRTAGKSHT